MVFVNTWWKAQVRRDGDDRIIVLPQDCVLEGEEITILQDRWGDIMIYPASPEGRKALEKLGPFAEWDDEDEER